MMLLIWLGTIIVGLWATAIKVFFFLWQHLILEWGLSQTDPWSIAIFLLFLGDCWYFMWWRGRKMESALARLWMARAERWKRILPG